MQEQKVSIIRHPHMPLNAPTFKFSNLPAGRQVFKFFPKGFLLNKFIFAVMKILMVCLGNICRSPMAEGNLQQKAWQAGLNWSVESAGTNGYHTGEPPHRLSQKVARHYGIDISLQRSRRFQPDDFHHFDKIYAMAGD